MKCPRHHIEYEIKAFERGKTVEVCPECEKERQTCMTEMFSTLRKDNTFDDLKRPK